MEKNKILINVDDADYEVFITHKKIKRIIMRVNSLMHINVSCPINLSQKKCLEFIYKNLDWLKKTIHERRRVYLKMNIKECLENKGCWLQGSFYFFEKTFNANEFFSFKENNLLIPANLLINSQFIDKIKIPFYDEIEDLFNFYKKTYADFVPENTTLVLKKLKSKWGSCNYKKNIIVINKALASVPVKLLQFVLIHEFIHFLYPNHGKMFKEKLIQILPNYRVLEKELRNYSFLLEKEVF